MTLAPAMLLMAAPVPAYDSDWDFSHESDLIALHYDHAADRDDGQSAAADRTILESEFGCDWIDEHVTVVSGAYGENRDRFREESEGVMEAVWRDCGGYLSAHENWDAAVEATLAEWTRVLAAGGDVWVKEGGQSDLTAEVVKAIKQKMPDVDTRLRIHVVQHAGWNERMTTDAALDYVQAETDYIKIGNANKYLHREGGDAAFEAAARNHERFGAAWAAAFEYYPPSHNLDFSDTGELLHILGFGEMDIDAVREKWLDAGAAGSHAQ